MKKASLVIPAYNQAQYLGACLDSAWFQDYPNLEIIAVNDGSSDETAEVLREFEASLHRDQASFASYFDADKDCLERLTHPRYPLAGREFKIITHPRNQGLASALNTGFAAATGEYCTYVPCDDWLLPSMISELAAALEENDADFAYADMLIVDDNGRILRRFNLPDYSFARSFADWYLCGNCKLYRRSLHERFGYYDEALLAHDHELFQRFALAGARFAHVPLVLLKVRDHGSREKDIHSPSNWARLIGESKRLVLEARAAQAKGFPG